jgi:hypothetical protein
MMEVGPSSALGNTERLPDLPVCEPFDVVHHDDRALPVGEMQ